VGTFSVPDIVSLKSKGGRGSGPRQCLRSNLGAGCRQSREGKEHGKRPKRTTERRDHEGESNQRSSRLRNGTIKFFDDQERKQILDQVLSELDSKLMVQRVE